MHSCVANVANLEFWIGWLYGYFLFASPEKKEHLQTTSLSNNLPEIVGGTLGFCGIVIIGVVFALFLIRYAS